MRHFLRCSGYAFPCRLLAARWQTRKVPCVASRSALKHSARSVFTASGSEPCELARNAQYEMAEYGGTDIFFSSRGRSSHFTSVSGGSCVVVGVVQAPRQAARKATEWASIACLAMRLTFALSGASKRGSEVCERPFSSARLAGPSRINGQRGWLCRQRRARR